MRSLKALRAKKAELELAREVATLEADVRARELAASVFWKEMPEAWGDRIATDEFLYDGVGMSDFGSSSNAAGRRSQATDRYRGDNAPIWSTETEHAQIRGVARVIAAVDEVGGGALENLVNYCVGQGFSYEVTPSKEAEESSTAKTLAATAKRLIDEFCEENSWWGDGEREAFTRSRRDGEQHLVLYPGTSGFSNFSNFSKSSAPKLRFVDPSFVVEPDRPRALEDFLGLAPSGSEDTLDWKYGHGAAWNDSTKTEWLFVSWCGDPLQWEAVPEERFVHLKLNVDREVKRGLSDFYPVYRNLQNADKLLQNTVQGEAVRQAIAYIREHSEGVTGSQIQSFVASRADQRYDEARGSSMGGTRTRYGRNIKPGTVVDAGHGMRYHDGPTSRRSHSAVELIQAALRIVGVRWQQPEYLISGDASNGNFASTLVAEAPFTKSAEAKQTYYCAKYAELMWKMLDLAYLSGAFPMPAARAKRLLILTVTGPAIAVRNRLEDHQIRKEEAEAGILSKATWAAEANRDYEEEVKKGAKEKAPEPVFGKGRDGGDDDD